MDATLSDEEQLLAENANRVAADLRKVTGPDGVLDPDVAWAALDESGLVAMRAQGATAVDVALCVEAFATQASPAPLVGPVLAVELARLAGADVPERTTIALTGSLAGLGPDGAGAVAFDALGATTALGLSGSGPLVAALSGATRVESADLSRVVLAVEGFGPAAGRLDDPGRWRAFALATVCADMVGAMSGALGMAVEYARQRHQFGKAIGSFQAVQHLCAEQLVSLEASRSATYWAAWAVDALAPAEALHAATVAKAYVARVGRPVVEAVLQVYGGIGQTWECDGHRYLRRVLVDRAVLGDEREHELAVAARRTGGPW